MSGDNREKLLELMEENGIRVEDLPSLTSYSESMVKAWMMPERTSKRARAVPDRALELLQLKLQAAKTNLAYDRALGRHLPV